MLSATVNSYYRTPIGLATIAPGQVYEYIAPGRTTPTGPVNPATAAAGVNLWPEEIVASGDGIAPPSPTMQWQDDVEIYGRSPASITVSDYLSKVPYSKQGLKHMVDDGEQFYNKPLRQILPPSRGKKQDGLVGLEIECEGTHLFDAPFVHWSCHQDGSLRAVKDHPPVEYVLKKPLSMVELYKALKYLEQKLKNAGSTIVKSTRTSVHVHVNVQDFTLRQLYCFILLYLIFEEVLVEWSGPERIGNLFCLRAKDSDFYLQMLETALKQQNLAAWKEDYRYSACNVASVLKFGSLEFRSLRGTVDADLIYTWAEMLVLLKEKSMNYDNPIKIVEEFTQIGPLPFFRLIFSNEKLRRLLEEIPEMSGKLWDGLRMMRDVAHCCEWLPPLKKDPNEPTTEENQQQQQDLEEQEAPLHEWFQGQIYPTNQGNFQVKTDYNNSTANRSFYTVPYFDAVGTVDDRSVTTIPPGYTMYYISGQPQWQGCYLVLQIVPGLPIL